MAHQTLKKVTEDYRAFKYNTLLAALMTLRNHMKQVRAELQGSPAWQAAVEALVLMLCQQMPFRGVARLVNLSPYQTQAICRVYVDLAVAQADYGEVRQLAIDETSRARWHDYVTLAADAQRRAVIFVSEGRDAEDDDEKRNHDLEVPVQWNSLDFFLFGRVAARSRRRVLRALPGTVGFLLILPGSVLHKFRILSC